MPVKVFLIWILSASSAFNADLYMRVNQLGFAPSDVKTAIVFGQDSLRKFSGAQ